MNREQSKGEKSTQEVTSAPPDTVFILTPQCKGLHIPANSLTLRISVNNVMTEGFTGGRAGREVGVEELVSHTLQPTTS